ncbi:MAG TPA: hypothetical protein DEA82_10770 [Flavobacteriaceae bacterium]|nr:hypothetical protein [Flavobacteriaceae bacterium]
MGSFALGKKAKGISDRSGFEYLLKDMRKEWNGLFVGKDEFETKQPQLGPFRTVVDPQSLQNARPPQEVAQERAINWGWLPVGQAYNFGLTPNPLASTGSVGSVTVVIT